MLVAGLLACLGPGAAWAQAYQTMASQPDPSDFVRRADSQLTLLGNPLRFGGVNVTWLGLRQDDGSAARRPTKFEVGDVLQTALALGAAVVRVPGLVSTAGCALCLEPTAGTLSADAFAEVDRVLEMARNLGLKVILPLADSGADCAGTGATGVICGEQRLTGRTQPGAFFTDRTLRAVFLARVGLILAHVNTLNGIAYRDDPTILAWEDCEACAAVAPSRAGSDQAGSDRAVSDWVEALGQAVKAADHRHLFEDGAFAGRIGSHAASPAPVGLYTTPSVDVVGDRLDVPGDPQAARPVLAETVALVGKASRVYLLDSFGWGPSAWKTEPALEGWLDDMARERSLAGALTGNLQGHAEQGGFLPAPPGAPGGLAALYFPGTSTAATDLPTMTLRDRALRRFFFAMLDVAVAPAYLLAPKPEIIGVVHGKVVWRGAAGAATYTVERSADPSSPGTWQTVCEACATDRSGGWTDPSPVAGDWYRVMPLNINGHHSLPSDPVRMP